MSDELFIAYETLPPKDGAYLARMDDEDEPEKVTIDNGKAFRDGKQRIYYGYEWKALQS